MEVYGRPDPRDTKLRDLREEPDCGGDGYVLARNSGGSVSKNKVSRIVSVKCPSCYVAYADQSEV